jgi:hypothetical protein
VAFPLLDQRGLSWQAVGLKVAILEPDRALVLQGTLPIARRPPFDSTWAFILCEQPDGTTRLLSRERYGYRRWWAPFVVEPTQVISLVMSRKMLLGIRDRAEGASRSAALVLLPGRPPARPFSVAETATARDSSVDATSTCRRNAEAL